MNIQNTHFPARLALYSAIHCLVDLACTFLIFEYLWAGPYRKLAFILFYFTAFAGQMPIGALADKLNKNASIAACGCMFVVLGFICFFVTGFNIPAAIIAGLGNAMFHVGGGLDVLNESGKKSGPLGIFVSPGAIGLFVGGFLARGDFAASIPLCALLVLATAAILTLQVKTFHGITSLNASFSLKPTLPQNMSKWLVPAIACLFVVVCMRSYVGLTLSFDWKTQWYWGVILLTALVAGKASGGLLSDKFGMKRTALVSLSAAAILFMFPAHPICGTLAVFLFNMTMPMTLWALASIFSNAKGFAFGTLTLALFVGFFVTVLHPAPILPMGWGFALAALLSLALLLPGIHPVSK